MRYGHGHAGIIGFTLKPETLKTRALSLHICSHLESNLVDGEKMYVQKRHKEESNTTIANDAHDREGLRNKLDICIDPLDRWKHPDDIVNIVSGRLGPSTANVHNTIEIGRVQMWVIRLQASSRDVDIYDVLSHELAPIPTSMFTEVEETRISKAKYVLKK